MSEGLFNLGTLFSDIVPDTRASLRAQGVQEANAAQLPGGMAAMLAPQRFNNMRKAAGGLFGVDTSNARERLKAALGKLDMSTPEGQKEAVRITNNVSPEKALALQNVFDTQAQNKAASAAQTSNAAANTANVDLRERELGALERAAVGQAQSAVRQRQQQAAVGQAASRVFAAQGQPELANLVAQGNLPVDEVRQLITSAKGKDTSVQSVVRNGRPMKILIDNITGETIRELGEDANLANQEVFQRASTNARMNGILPDDATNASLLADSMLSLAFDPDLESVVGPSEGRRLIPTFARGAADAVLGTRGAQLNRDVARGVTANVLPLARALAPVTEIDFKALSDIQLGFPDSQEVWIDRTLTETIPRTVTAMRNSAIKEGKDTAAVDFFAFKAVERVLSEAANNPQVFGDLSIPDTITKALKILPTKSQASNTNTQLFLDKSGRVMNAQLVQTLADYLNLDIESLIEERNLEAITNE
jgi:hypothetical protein